MMSFMAFLEDARKSIVRSGAGFRPSLQIKMVGFSALGFNQGRFFLAVMNFKGYSLNR